MPLKKSLKCLDFDRTNNGHWRNGDETSDLFSTETLGVFGSPEASRHCFSCFSWIYRFTVWRLHRLTARKQFHLDLTSLGALLRSLSGLARCSDDRKCPKSRLTLTDFGTRQRGYYLYYPYQLCLSRQLLLYTVLSTGCAPLLQCLGRLSLTPFVGR